MSLANAQAVFQLLDRANIVTCTLRFSHPDTSLDISHNGLLIISVNLFTQFTHNQLNNRIDLIQHGIRIQKIRRYDIVYSGEVNNYTTCVMHLTRGCLLKQDNWMDWQNSEYLQLNQYGDQGCFGAPASVKKDNAIFHLVWTYNIKALDGRKKACCICNGSSHSGSVKILDKVYANCVDQTSAQLFYAITAAKNMLVYGSEVCNAFAEAPPRSKVSLSDLIGHSTSGGRSTRATLPSPPNMSSQSSLLCKAIPSPLDCGKSMPIQFYRNSGSHL